MYNASLKHKEENRAPGRSSLRTSMRTSLENNYGKDRSRTSSRTVRIIISSSSSTIMSCWHEKGKENTSSSCHACADRLHSQLSQSNIKLYVLLQSMHCFQTANTCTAEKSVSQWSAGDVQSYCKHTWPWGSDDRGAQRIPQTGWSWPVQLPVCPAVRLHQDGAWHSHMCIWGPLAQGALPEPCGAVTDAYGL